MSAALAAVREAFTGREVWVVGGAVRDRLLGREVLDVDVVLDGDVRAAARHLAVMCGGPSFALSDAFGSWRVLAPDRGWQVDLTPLHGGSLDADLARRDLTVNAIAEPIDGGPLHDPHGGCDDLAARRLRMVSEQAFDDDPLRVLRVARLATELGFEAEPATVAAAAARAPRMAEVAGERVFAELKRLVACDTAVAGLRLADRLGVVEHVLPELTAMRGVAQNRFHHLDVHDHTLEVLDAVIALQHDPAGVLGDTRLARDVLAWLDQPLADDLTRGGALRWAALLHDAAKPATRRDFGEGRVGFPGHDTEGALVARDALARLRAAERLRAHVAALTRHHLRLGFLVHERPLDRRAVFRYLVACDPVAVDVTVLTVADRLATRGDNAGPAIAAHLELVRELLPAALAWEARDRTPLVRGDVLAAELGLRPGPRLGELLADIDEARYAGEVATPQEAVALARRLAGPAD